MLEEIQRRHYSEATTQRYIRLIERFAQHFHRSPDRLSLRAILPLRIPQFFREGSNFCPIAPHCRHINFSVEECGCTSPFRPIAPGKMSISIARWFSLSVHGKTLWRGAIDSDRRMGKMFLCTRSRSLPEHGMAPTQTRTGISGPLLRLKRS